MSRPRIHEHWQSKPDPTRIVCKAYIDPPSANRRALALVWTYSKGAHLGLVHDVEISDNFVSIRVPDPGCRGRLVWVNVMRIESHTAVDGSVVLITGVVYACPVPSWTVLMWHERGWQDTPLYQLPAVDSILCDPMHRRALPADNEQPPPLVSVSDTGATSSSGC